MSFVLTSIVLPNRIHDTHEDVQHDLARVATVAEIDASKLGGSRLCHVGASIRFLLVVASAPYRHGQRSDEEEASPSAPDAAEASIVDGHAEEERTKDLEKPVEQRVQLASAKSEQSAVE